MLQDGASARDVARLEFPDARAKFNAARLTRRAAPPGINAAGGDPRIGSTKHVTVPVTVGGVTFTPADLKAVFTAHTAALDAADGLHKQWTDQLLVSDAAGAKAKTTYQSLRCYLVGQYGSSANAVLHDFGMTPPKPTGPKTVKTKAEAAAKRAARHTMGKNQKKGDHRRHGDRAGHVADGPGVFCGARSEPAWAGRSGVVAHEPGRLVIG